MNTISVQDDRGLTCPGCGGTLTAVRASAHYGRVIIVDQCGACGGVWFDRWELYSLSVDALRVLRDVDPKALFAPNPAASGSGQCPCCHTQLILYRDPVLPKDAQIKRCDGCYGLWLNRDGMARYSTHKEAVTGAGPERFKITEEAAEAALRLEKELCLTQGPVPVDFSGLPPINSSQMPDFSDPLVDRQISPKEIAKDMAYLILASLIRLVIPF